MNVAPFHPLGNVGVDGSGDDDAVWRFMEFPGGLADEVGGLAVANNKRVSHLAIRHLEDASAAIGAPRADGTTTELWTLAEHVARQDLTPWNAR
jgi:hypothetical protein